MHKFDGSGVSYGRRPTILRGPAVDDISLACSKIWEVVSAVHLTSRLFLMHVLVIRAPRKMRKRLKMSG